MVQAGPGKPRQAQAGPGRPRQAQTGPGRPRQAQAGPNSAGVNFELGLKVPAPRKLGEQTLCIGARNAQKTKPSRRLAS